MCVCVCACVCVCMCVLYLVAYISYHISITFQPNCLDAHTNTCAHTVLFFLCVQFWNYLDSHKTIEKKWRDRINNYLDQLKSLVPDCRQYGSKKLDKAEMLEMSIDREYKTKGWGERPHWADSTSTWARGSGQMTWQRGWFKTRWFTLEQMPSMDCVLMNTEGSELCGTDCRSYYVEVKKDRKL